jgi:hypothetical protein
MTKIRVGQTKHGDPVTWDTTSSAHLLISGSTGVGKTSLTTTLTSAASANGWEIHTGGAGDVGSTIRRVHDELRRRLDGCDLTGPPILVVLQDVTRLYDLPHDQLTLSKHASLEHRAMMARIAATGRSAQIHLVMTARRPCGDLLGRDLKGSPTARVAIGNLSPQAAYLLFGDVHLAGTRSPMTAVFVDPATGRLPREVELDACRCSGAHSHLS